MLFYKYIHVYKTYYLYVFSYTIHFQVILKRNTEFVVDLLVFHRRIIKETTNG
jgi:hypothetical protein